MALIKNLKRLVSIVNNALFSLAPGVGNQLFSILVNRYFFPQWWGIIVELQLIQYFVTGICAWGNKEFLTREFGKLPLKAKSLWNLSLSSRFYLLLFPSLLVLFFFLPAATFVHVSLWIISRFFAQSFESIITTHKKFGYALAIEISSALILSAGVILLFNTITLNQILLLITLSNLARPLAYLILFRSWVYPSQWFKPAVKILKQSIPFMLLAFTGLIQTKIDLALLDMLMPKTELARYQIFTNFLILIRTGSAFLLYPFLSNIYRLPVEKIKRVSNVLFWAGMIISDCGLMALSVLMHYVYLMPDELNWYLWGLIACIPGYWFGPVVFYLFRQNQEMKVITANIIGIVLNAIILIISIGAFGISGALAAMAISQIAMMIFYYFELNSKPGTLNSGTG